MGKSRKAWAAQSSPFANNKHFRVLRPLACWLAHRCQSQGAFLWTPALPRTSPVSLVSRLNLLPVPQFLICKMRLVTVYIKASKTVPGPWWGLNKWQGLYYIRLCYIVLIAGINSYNHLWKPLLTSEVYLPGITSQKQQTTKPIGTTLFLLEN